MAQRLTVADLDPITTNYKVVDESRYILGHKLPAGVLMMGSDEGPIYLKPEYTKRGTRTGGKHSSYSDRAYKSTPPWLKCEVVKIDQLGGDLTFHVKTGKE